MEKTLLQYNRAFEQCKEIFRKKTRDYGTAWRILRPSSLTDQLFIKAQRIRTIQENGQAMINEGEQDEFVGIVNYSIMALVQLGLPANTDLELSYDKAVEHYEQHAAIAQKLMIAKNTDYGEAWRDMRISSLTDLILMKILRVKQIEDNKGKTLISEGIDANYLDMINYALFALIKIEEETPVKS
ncbi:MAG: DUF1599 domain-containing protein [Bacteroidota bacterium]